MNHGVLSMTRTIFRFFFVLNHIRNLRDKVSPSLEKLWDFFRPYDHSWVESGSCIIFFDLMDLVEDVCSNYNSINSITKIPNLLLRYHSQKQTVPKPSENLKNSKNEVN